MLRLNEVYCGRCTDLMDAMNAASVDLTVTSPPYDKLREYNGYEFNFEDIARGLYRVTKSGGVVVWVVADATIKGSETGTSFRQALHFMSLGFNLHDTMIYHKDNPAPVGGNNRYYQSFEYMFIFTKGRPTFNPIIVPRRNKWNDKRTTRYRGVTRGVGGNFTKKEVPIKTHVKKQNLWTYVVSGGASSTDKIAHKHPAIFPEKLAEDHILSWSNPGGLVFDPMCGSGTTCKMALKNDRLFLGCDISQEYANIAKTRINSI